MTEPIADLKQREEALDPRRSFIVQAPAGSGKTELLIQRFLTLLARVERPEEIAALTFTRKAASEMRSRVVAALTASEPVGNAPPNERKTYELAQKALARDGGRWQLAQNPSRLRIQTIDAFCAQLARQLPLTSRLGAELETVEDATALYIEAARATLAHFGSASPWSTHVEIVLEHLDNDWAKYESLLVPMLERRDQWVRGIAGEPDKAQCETALAHVIADAVAAACAACPPEIIEELLHAVRFAAKNLIESGVDSEIAHCASLRELPTRDLSPWLGLAKLLLTDKDEWRKAGGVTARIGFPANGGKNRANMKARMSALLDQVSFCDQFRACLIALRNLPAATYSENQWRVLKGLIGVLKLASAELSLVFQKCGKCDFIAVAHAALRALGEDGEPSDLALALDQRIAHLLVDEFQDTSASQYDLITRLTAGWQSGDGRTLLLVGDPMQSIYGFRRAEVGLFLHARNKGLGGLKLESISLSTNFRSHAGLVEWVNRTFDRVLPLREDIGEGAVPFSPAAWRTRAPENAKVEVHPCAGFDPGREAEIIGQIASKASAAGQTIAVLVHSRDHLDAIVPQLTASGLRFKAVQIESLADTQIVRDLTSLTHAYLQLADRIAWLAILRAPWCGLSLGDLELISQGARTIWDNLCDDALLAGLSRDGHSRARQLKNIFDTAFAERGRRSLRTAIEGIWLALGGPACIADATELANAELYLEQLAAPDFEIAKVDELYAAPDARAGNELQLMTIHQAKGLEFDVVILPGLGRSRPSPEKTAIAWAERASDQGIDLLFAPIPPNTDKKEAIYTYLRDREKRRAALEAGRLLYVAATRAKHALHLLGHVKPPADPTKPLAAAKSAPLSKLWHAVEGDFLSAARSPASPPIARTQKPLYRLPLSWTLPDPPAPFRRVSPPSVSESPLDYLWVTPTARHVGTVVHQTLARVGRDGIEFWPASRIATVREDHLRALMQLGVPRHDRDRAIHDVERALSSTLTCPRGRWLFDPRHSDARTEYALTGIDAGELISVVLDRTFVDADGMRWIVDFKTGTHSGSDVETFLNNEQMRYAPQLQRYARIMRKLDPRPIRLGLYFPLLGGWREWAYQVHHCGEKRGTQLDLEFEENRREPPGSG